MRRRNGSITTGGGHGAARRYRLAALWAAAVGTIGFTTASVMLPASAVDEPNFDAITPSTNHTHLCAAGLAADEVCRTDNNAVNYYMDSNGEFELEQEDRDAVDDAIIRYRNNTTLTLTYDFNPDFSGNTSNDTAETDIVYQEGDFGFPDSYKGVTWCDDRMDNTDFRCDQQYIRMRGAGVIDAIVTTHETGHALGLMHPNFWAPERGICHDVAGIMRADYNCIPNAALGDAVRNNINWVYQ